MTKKAKIYNREKSVPSICGAGKIGHPAHKRMRLEHFLTPYTKKSKIALKQ